MFPFGTVEVTRFPLFVGTVTSIFDSFQSNEVPIGFPFLDHSQGKVVFSQTIPFNHSPPHMGEIPASCCPFSLPKSLGFPSKTFLFVLRLARVRLLPPLFLERLFNPTLFPHLQPFLRTLLAVPVSKLFF